MTIKDRIERAAPDLTASERKLAAALLADYPYAGLVAIVTLAGEARFFVCDDRAGAGAREVPIPPGGLCLMRAPGFAGLTDRPFHYLSEVGDAGRISRGIRHDTRPGEPL